MSPFASLAKRSDHDEWRMIFFDFFITDTGMDILRTPTFSGLRPLFMLKCGQAAVAMWQSSYPEKGRTACTRGMSTLLGMSGPVDFH
jgi:hypothetical protein